MRQGPWTDIFALASTCYFMLTGRPPVPATARILSDELLPLVELSPPGFSKQTLATLDWAMSVRPEDRPQSAATFWDALHGHLRVPVRTAPPLASRGRRAVAKDFERTVQTSESGAKQRQVRPPPGAAAIPPLHSEQPRESAMATLWSGPFRRLSMLLLGTAGLAAGATFWIGSWKTQSVIGNPVAQAAAAASASSGVAASPIANVASGAPLAQTGASATASVHEPSSPAVSPEATDPIMKAERDWVAAHEASASAQKPRRSVTARSTTQNRHVSLRERCQASEPAAADACMKRLCSSDPAYQRDDACAGTSSPVKHWWQFWKAASAP